MCLALSFLIHSLGYSGTQSTGGVGSRWFAPVLSPPLGFGLPEVLELSLDPPQCPEHSSFSANIYRNVQRGCTLLFIWAHILVFHPHAKSYRHPFVAHVQTGTAEPGRLSGGAWSSALERPLPDIARGCETHLRPTLQPGSADSRS